MDRVRPGSWRWFLAPTAVCLCAFVGACTKLEPEQAPAAGIEVTSSVLESGAPIAARFTGDGEDLSPPISWSTPPEGTVSVAIIMDDPDAPRGTFTHWLLWGLDPDVTALPPGIATKAEISEPVEAVQGTNDFGQIGYRGPSPPPGREHRYFIKVFALDTHLDLEPGARRSEVEEAIREHVIERGEFMGTYARRR